VKKTGICPHCKTEQEMTPIHTRDEDLYIFGSGSPGLYVNVRCVKGWMMVPHRLEDGSPCPGSDPATAANPNRRLGATSI